MPETPYTPPETKYEVHIDEFMKAVRGEPFTEGNGLYRMTGKEIKEETLLEDYYLDLKDNQEYVLLIESKLVEGEAIELTKKEQIDYGIGFVFSKSIIPDIILEQAKIKELYFYKAQSGNIILEGNSQCGNIRIEENSRCGDIGIEENSQCGNINVEENSHLGLIEILDNSLSGSINIWDNSFLTSINIEENSQCGNISIENNSYLDSISVQDGSQSGDIIIDNNSKPITINVEDNSQTGDFDFFNARLDYIVVEDNHFGLTIHGTQFFMMRIHQCLLTFLEWGAGTKGELYTSGQTRILHLQLTHTSLLKDSLLSLSDTPVHYAILEELQVQGYFLMRQLSAPKEYPFSWRDIASYLGEEPQEAWEQQRWQSKKQLLERQRKQYDEKVDELKQQYGNNPIFRISHSSLGKTEITGSNLTGYRFEYLNSKLLDCFITGTELPKNIILPKKKARLKKNELSEKGIFIYSPLGSRLSEKDQYEQATSIYNQFKKIYENQGDVVEASEYHAYAMRYQQKLLWWKLRHTHLGFWKKVKLLFENIGFRLNWFSNNHGESWLVAFVFTIAMGFIFFTASIWALTHFWDWTAFNTNIHKLPGFMLPTHAVDYLSKDITINVNLWHTTWDFLGRIFIGYGFFQFIAAFRRHGKKGG